MQYYSVYWKKVKIISKIQIIVFKNKSKAPCKLWWRDRKLYDVCAHACECVYISMFEFLFNYNYLTGLSEHKTVRYIVSAPMYNSMLHCIVRSLKMRFVIIGSFLRQMVFSTATFWKIKHNVITVNITINAIE